MAAIEVPYAETDSVLCCFDTPYLFVADADRWPGVGLALFRLDPVVPTWVVLRLYVATRETTPVVASWRCQDRAFIERSLRNFSSDVIGLVDYLLSFTLGKDVVTFWAPTYREALRKVGVIASEPLRTRRFASWLSGCYPRPSKTYKLQSKPPVAPYSPPAPRPKGPRRAPSELRALREEFLELQRWGVIIGPHGSERVLFDEGSVAKRRQAAPDPVSFAPVDLHEGNDESTLCDRAFAEVERDRSFCCDGFFPMVDSVERAV